jgi:hypothetical protein
MSSDEVKYRVAEYFRYKRQASLVMFERGLPSRYGNPDVVVVTDDLRLIEVEVKVSWSDYRNDAKKYKWRLNRDYEHMFYYAAPIELAKRIAADTDKGVIQIGEYVSQNMIIKRAQKCEARISHQHYWKLIRHQTGTMISVMRDWNDLSKRLADLTKGKSLEELLAITKENHESRNKL